MTMKKVLLYIIISACMSSLIAQSAKKITIIHTNDLHSRLIGFAPESSYTPLVINNDLTIGGFARIGSIIKEAKEKEKGTTLVVDAGDFMMGTLFPSLELKTGFQLRLMKKMGFDVVGIGNHEYEFGPEWLASLISVSASKGEIPVLLSGNAKFDEKDKRDDSLEKLYKENLIRPSYILEKDGIKFGFFFLLGKDAVSVAPKAKPVTFTKQASFAKKTVKMLKDQKCDVIICVSHSGVTKGKDGSWSGEDVELAEAVKGIDIIIGGHTHTRLDQPIVVGNTSIFQTGEFGKFVGEISVTLSNGKVKVDNYKLIPVDDEIFGNEEVNSLIEEEKTKITSDVLKPLGLEYTMPVVENAFTIEGNDVGDYVNSNLGPLIADAIHSYINNHNSTGSDISMVAAGMIFDKIQPGIQTVPDIFRVMPLGSGKDGVPGYALSRLFITGKELKSILEILLVAGKSDAQNYCYYSGIKVEYNPDKGLLKKIKNIEIIKRDGRSVNVDFSKKNKTLYAISADSYMLEFIGIIKKMSFGLINVVPKDISGNRVTDMSKAVIDMNEKTDGIQEGKEWLALIEYLGSMQDTNGNGIPDVLSKYSGPVRTFFQINNK
jgi:5'-nucleotidase / UDP-sugar diphosphatase